MSAQQFYGDKGYAPAPPQQAYGGPNYYPPQQNYPQQGYAPPQGYPQGGYPAQQPMYVQQPQASDPGGDLCCGLLTGLACCCCLDAMF
ncbi:UV-induced protein uvi15 [Schizosaccharomyces pombe]|uniref:Lipid-anchored plasma membrane protein uvi15 n=1 Tax=Schizosaccharomyces pombe (strain 972 / ATCC 24843) TaxID=284812 RepID=UVI15_SCHPO|nr:UV-induced protein Uvi15 [Schizosaccharomyces pombe]P40388.2 RecName: Full=UV-induced protein uvi15 [Schizosaccharomyces pombe 972h-]CAA19046.1 UV-induced protein Uvi15 [Schizosaccharomyces pombe]|eukprot:NP_595223.1 UV-induced protein Uvi15 [Schizosaccharomyces pombe]